MNKTASIIVLVVYVTAWVTLAAGEVGTVTRAGDDVGWDFPLQFLILLVVPAFLGYIIGQSRRE